MRLKKLIGKIHLWLGMASGTVVFIVSVTGCIYVFKEEISALVYEDKYYVKSVSEKDERKPFTELYQEAKRNLSLDPLYVEIFDGPKASFAFWTWTTNESSWSYFGKTPIYETVYIDPYTGKTLFHENRKMEFFNIVLGIHWSLLLNDKIGGNIVGVSTIIFIIMLLSGLVLWWPHNRKSLKMRTWFRWKPTTKWKRKNYDIHNIAGFYMMFFSLLIALTGLVWVYDWMDSGMKWLANGGTNLENKTSVSSIVDSIQLPKKDRSNKSIRLVFDKYPEANRYWLVLEKGSSLPTYITVRNNTHHNLENVSYSLNKSGYLVPAPVLSEKSNGDKLAQMNYDLHVGSILGFPGKVLAFLASLVSASLPVTGFLIWYGRNFKKRRKKMKRPSKTKVINETEEIKFEREGIVYLKTDPNLYDSTKK